MKKPAALTPRQVFARNLRLCRHVRAISQEDLANKAGMSRSYLSGVETDHRASPPTAPQPAAGGPPTTIAQALPRPRYATAMASPTPQ